MANRPTGRTVTYYKKRTWDDDVKQLSRDQRVARAENGAKSSYITDESPLGTIKHSADIKYKRRQDNYDKNPPKPIRVDKRYSALQALQRKRKFNNENNSAEKSDSSKWKMTPKNQRKVQKLTSNIPIYGGGYWRGKPKKWDDAVFIHNTISNGTAMDSNRKRSSIVGTDSPLGRLEQKSAGIDHNQKNATQRYAMYKTTKQMNKAAKNAHPVKTVKRSLAKKTDHVRPYKNAKEHVAAPVVYHRKKAANALIKKIKYVSKKTAASSMK